MQEDQDLSSHQQYLVRKLLAAIPGTDLIVCQKLTALLQDPSSSIDSSEDKNLQVIINLLRNPKTKDLTRRVIEEKIRSQSSAFNLPSDIIKQIFLYIEINKLLAVMLVNKAWYRASLHQWRALLVRDFGVTASVAQLLPNPNLVYFRIIFELFQKKLCKYPALPNRRSYIEKYGLDSFCVCYDVQNTQQLYNFFQGNVIPDISDVALLGNVTLVKFLQHNCHRVLFHHANDMRHSGSIPLGLYTFREMPSFVFRSYYRPWYYPPDLNLVFRHLDELVKHHRISYADLALTGSVEAFKGNIPQKECDDRPEIIISNAIRSRSLPLIKYFFEDPSFSMRKEFDADIQIRGKKILDEAAAWGVTSIVKYLIHSQGIAPSYDTLHQAFRSGSILLVGFLIDYLKQTTSDSLYMAPYQESAVRSGSLRMVEYIKSKSENNECFTKSSLDVAAEVGLLPAFCFILASAKPPAADQKTLVCALRSLVPNCMLYLLKTSKLTLSLIDLKTIYDLENLFTLRQALEEQSSIVDENDTSSFSEAWSGNSKYLRSITSSNCHTSFWNKVLSFPFKNTVASLKMAIIYDAQGNPQRWLSKELLAFRIFKGVHFVNAYRSLDSVRITNDPFENSSDINVEIPYLMAEILTIIDKIKIGDRETSFSTDEQNYLTALEKIVVKLRLGASLKYESEKAIAFYKYWHQVVSNVIATKSELTPQRLESSRLQISTLL